ncbi:MAG: hypothetical protein JW776_05455 [Candidatus Lokiarchaeota archaeon]|nr:hypothetical protein [Candidatus Lokiarchaeota archaeon]
MLYDPQEIYDTYRINRFQLVDLSILIGNDYTPGIKGIGPKKGIELLHKHRNLEQLPNKIREKIPLNVSDIGIIRSLFLIPNVLTTIPELSFTYPNRGGILELMTVDHSLHRDRVSKGIKRLLKAHFLMKITHIQDKRK